MELNLRNDRSKRRAATRKVEVAAMQEGRVNRAIRFIDRRKEDAKKACRRLTRYDV